MDVWNFVVFYLYSFPYNLFYYIAQIPTNDFWDSHIKEDIVIIKEMNGNLDARMKSIEESMKRMSTNLEQIH